MKISNNRPPHLLKNIRLVLLTWFGSGLIPKAPGTAGTMATLPLAWLALSFPLWGKVALATFITALASWLAALDQAENQNKDPQYVVIDESAGILWSILPLASTGQWANIPLWVWFIAAFALFRLFDVVKPFPSGFFDRISKRAATATGRGLGIVFDDVIAGLYVSATLFIAQLYISGT
jgi:phosphatidylglycerophosphatase A